MVAVVVLVLLIALCVSVREVVGIEKTCSSEYGVSKSIQKEMLVERLL
jgi:hypothetical protein